MLHYSEVDIGSMVCITGKNDYNAWANDMDKFIGHIGKVIYKDSAFVIIEGTKEDRDVNMSIPRLRDSEYYWHFGYQCIEHAHEGIICVELDD